MLIVTLCAAVALLGAADCHVISPPLETNELVLPPLVEKTGREEDCPSGWSLFGQRCFRVMWTPRTWAESERECLVQGANLASVHSTEEYHFLQRMTTSVTWIGGYDATQERLWFWSDGSRMVYQNWAPGEPNNEKGREHCMNMNWAGGLQWNDERCGSRIQFICARGV